MNDEASLLDILIYGRRAIRAANEKDVTNYFYDQWLRLWLLGGSDEPRSWGETSKGKFTNRCEYVEMLQAVLTQSKPLLTRDATVFVRTHARTFTLESTIEALERAFPNKRLREELHSRPSITQTALFDSDIDSEGEVDLVMW